LRDMRGRLLRPFEFERTTSDIGPATYVRTTTSSTKAADSGDGQWRSGDQLFIPVMREDGSVFGFLSLEAPVDEARPKAEIMQLLDVLLTHGALHLQAQRLRDELKKRAAELELRVHERTRDLRLSEERFSRLVNSTTDIVYVTDENDKLTFLNEAFTKTLGYVRENYIGRALKRLLEELTTENPINHRALQELAQLAGEHTLHHVEVLTRQGDKRTLEINRTIVRQGGIVTGTQGIIRDITEHRVLLQQLVASERLAATGRLAAGIAHEINNPLQGLSSQIKTIDERAKKKENISENVELLQDGIDRIRHIVRSLLDLHRSPSATHAPVQMNELVQKVNALMGQQIRERNVTVAVDLAKNLPLVLASPPEVQQVLINLILNALDAMPDGGDLTIKTRVSENSVQISVRDNGIGIAAEHLPQLFEPFFTFKPAGSGTGLGLYLSKNIMDLHNGKISVESEKGKGACFTLTFPRN
ncbi:MAG: two-component system sensor histidine kinase NtrB, partial [Calditrichota bacterium]